MIMNSCKQYLVFGFSNYYSAGGMGDCQLKTNNLEEALVFVESEKLFGEYCQVYDVLNNRLIFDGAVRTLNKEVLSHIIQ